MFALSDRFCAVTKTVPERAFVHNGIRRHFCNGAKPRRKVMYRIGFHTIPNSLFVSARKPIRYRNVLSLSVKFPGRLIGM